MNAEGIVPIIAAIGALFAGWLGYSYKTGEGYIKQLLKEIDELKSEVKNLNKEVLSLSKELSSYQAENEYLKQAVNKAHPNKRY